MKAKTTKFLAVLAVLAMAFASVAVLAQEQIDMVDAAPVEGATERAEGHNVSLTIDTVTTYYTTAAKALSAVDANQTATITLLASHEGAGLKTRIVPGTSDTAITGSKVTIDFAGFTYTVNEAVGSPNTETAGSQLRKDNEYVFKSGTLDAVPTDKQTKKLCDLINSYAKLTLEDMVLDGTNLTGGNQWVIDPPMPELDGITVTVWLQNGATEIKGSTTIITGAAGTKANYGLGVNYWPALYSDGAHVTVKTTGEINGILMALDAGTSTPDKISTLDIQEAKIYGEVYTYPTMADGKFIITGATVPEGKTLTNNGKIAFGGKFVVDGQFQNNGQISGTVEIGDADELKMEYGSTIANNMTFKYTDEYSDVHSVTFGTGVVAGMEDGFTVYSGQNMIGVTGTFVLSATTAITYTGNLTVSGLVYTANGQNLSFTGHDNFADMKISSFQVVGAGNVILESSALVTAGTSFYVMGGLYIGGMEAVNDDDNDDDNDVDDNNPPVADNDPVAESDAVLKVAENAIVKVEGTLGLNGKIWNAGQFIATSYADPAKLTKVYMNSAAGMGTFYEGSVVKSVTASAYGAYLDMTGKSTVNLTAANINVENNLYKNYTMILATQNTVIPLTVDFPNQYAADIALNGKDYSVPASESTAKSATFRGVVWDSANNAIISVVAPEEYTVQLIKTHTTPDNVITPVSWWDSTGVVVNVKDPAGRVIPISVDGDGRATVKLVFGVEYTVTGLVATSNYNFDDLRGVFKDLTKDSQTQGSFTMIRNVDENADDKTTFVYLEITEGKKDTITVTLKDNDSKIAAGDVIFYYTTDGGKTVKALLKPTSGAITFDIFNNDTVFIKYPAIEYYKLVSEAALQDANLDITPVAKADKMTGWTDKLVPVNTKTTGAMIVTCSLNNVLQTFKLDIAKAEGKTSAITVEFSKWYEGSAVHGAKKTLLWDNTNTATLDMFVGEVYTLSWTDVDDVWEKMTYKLDVEGAETQNYEERTSVPVDATSRTYTLTLDNIEYAAVKNMSEKDFTVTDGYFVTPVEMTKTADKAVEAKSADRSAATVVSLKLEGQTVVAWTYSVTDKAGTAIATDVDVVGEAAAIKLVDGDTITVTKLSTIYNPYIVKIQPVEHMKIGDYSRVGYINDRMFIYASADELFKVTGVEVYYEDPAHEGFPGGFYTDALFSTDLGYWYYPMPASNVVLKAQIESDFGTITFKNWDEQVLETKAVQKGLTPVYSGPEPTKPSTETQSYVWIGWEPELAPVTGDATYVAKFAVAQPTSTDVTIFLEKSTNGVKVTLLANDGRFIQDGSVEFTYTYAYELNGKWATGFKTCTAQTGEIGDKALFQFTVDLSEKERFAETMWILGAYTSADKAVNAVSELIVYQ